MQYWTYFDLCYADNSTPVAFQSLFLRHRLPWFHCEVETKHQLLTMYEHKRRHDVAIMLPYTQKLIRVSLLHQRIPFFNFQTRDNIILTSIWLNSLQNKADVSFLSWRINLSNKTRNVLLLLWGIFAKNY